MAEEYKIDEAFFKDQPNIAFYLMSNAIFLFNDFQKN
jgi:hypothetical protein